MTVLDPSEERTLIVVACVECWDEVRVPSSWWIPGWSQVRPAYLDWCTHLGICPRCREKEKGGTG